MKNGGENRKVENLSESRTGDFFTYTTIISTSAVKRLDIKICCDLFETVL